MFQELDSSEKLQLVDGSKLPVDCSDFKSILLNKMLFIDKSLLIKQIIQTSYKRIILLRPRKWGKTMNMEMLKLFFETVVIQVIQGQDKVKVLQPNMVFFQGGQAINQIGKKVTLKKLKIVKEQKWQKQYSIHQGQYPVIFLSFNFLQDDKDKLKFGVIKQIYKVYEQHHYLKYSNQFKQNFNQLMKLIQKQNQPHRSQQSRSKKYIDLQHYLLDLCSLLFQYHNRKVMIIIDDYDGCYANILTNSDIGRYSATDLLQIIQNLLNALGKQSIYIGKIIMTGTLNFILSKGESSSPFTTFNILNNDFKQFYGFTKTQIQEQIIQKRYQNLSEAQRDQFLSNIYQSYGEFYHLKQKNNFFDLSKIDPKQKIYNPYDIIRYFQNCKSKIEQFQQFRLKEINHLLFKKILFSSSLTFQLFLKVLKLVYPFKHQQQFQPFLYGECLTQNYKKIPQKISQQYFTDTLINLGYLNGIRNNKYYLMVVPPNLQFKKLFKKLLLKSFIQQNKENNVPKLKNLTDFQPCFQRLINKYEKQSKQHKKNFQRDNCFIFIIKNLILSFNHAYHICILNHQDVDSFELSFQPKQSQMQRQMLILNVKHCLNNYSEEQQKNLLSKSLKNIYKTNSTKKIFTNLKKNTNIKFFIIYQFLIFQKVQTQKFEKVLKMKAIHTPEEIFSIFNKQVSTNQ